MKSMAFYEIWPLANVQPAAIIDAGANIGIATVLFATTFRGATIVSINLDELKF